MTNFYTVGSQVNVTATFTVVATGATINPTAVTFTVRKPDGTQTTPTPSNLSTGVYQATLTIDQAGTWRWRATGTGAAVAQQDGLFEVTPNTF